MLQATEPSYLRTAQVAALFHVSVKTVSRWASEGMLPYRWTFGGHRRYPEQEIRALLGVLPEPSVDLPVTRSVVVWGSHAATPAVGPPGESAR
jgi:excisionase family DNA binding protein